MRYYMWLESQKCDVAVGIKQQNVTCYLVEPEGPIHPSDALYLMLSLRSAAAYL